MDRLKKLTKYEETKWKWAKGAAERELSQYSGGSVQVQRELQVKTNTRFGFWWDGVLTFSHNPPERPNSRSRRLGGHETHHNKMFQM